MVHLKGRGQATSVVAAALGLLVFAAANGCSSDKGFETREVERSEYASDWPFAADEGVLACELGNSPTFTVDGRTVGLSDPDFDVHVWADDASAEQAARMREAALALCE